MKKYIKKVNEVLCLGRGYNTYIKQFLWSLGAFLYSLGPFPLVLLLIISVYILDRFATFSNQQLIYISLGGFGLILSLLNFYLNRTKVNLQLFEERYKIYLNCHEIISQAVGIEKFYNDDKDEYLCEIYDNVRDDVIDSYDYYYGFFDNVARALWYRQFDTKIDIANPDVYKHPVDAFCNNINHIRSELEKTRLLFGMEVYNFVKEVYKNINELLEYSYIIKFDENQQYAEQPEEPPPDLDHKKLHDLHKRFKKQNDQAFKIFNPYLNFKHIY